MIFSDLNYISEDSIRSKWDIILDQAHRAVKKYQPMSTSFLTPAEWIYADEILNKIPDLCWFLDGGYEEAERKILMMKHDDLNAVPSESLIEALSIRSTSKFHTLSHRDYLGAILSLGIKRDKIGDLIVSENEAVVFAFKEMAEYIRLHLDKIGNCSVKITNVSVEELSFERPDYKLIKGTVASLRIDSLIALAYTLSRKDAQLLIRQDRVKVNWKPVNKLNQELQCNETISVSGYGRAVLLEVGGKTRSDRMHVTIGRKC
ncbi:MAG: RNA-binding protein [Tindallia sp. MSAO_Bac2]|nr:MAG: RNA-binding protein [Tindallia sp. MSAO_Bac2]